MSRSSIVILLIAGKKVIYSKLKRKIPTAYVKVPVGYKFVMPAGGDLTVSVCPNRSWRRISDY